MLKAINQKLQEAGLKTSLITHSNFIDVVDHVNDLHDISVYYDTKYNETITIQDFEKTILVIDIRFIDIDLIVKLINKVLALKAI